MSRRKGIPGLSFSWKRALGISSEKAKISRQIGIPLTRSGRQRRIGRAIESVNASRARQRGTRWMPPKTFQLYGRRYQLRHSNLGRVFIVTKNGVNVLGSSFFAI